MMACLIAGRLGFGGGPEILFFPFGLFAPKLLEEGERDHGHQRVSVQSFPRPTFEVVEAEFFLELLMRLFADPAGLDGAGQLLDRRVGGQVREVVLALAGRATVVRCSPTSQTSSPSKC